MAVTSKIARIRVGPNARNKTTLYTATKVTGPTGNPPQYSTEIIQYSDAKGSNGVVIGTQDQNNPGKITWNDNASATAQKYQQTISKASTTQVKSVSNDIATTAEEKAALNKVSGSNNAAVNSGTDSARPAGGQGNQDINSHNTHNRGGAGGGEDNSEGVGVNEEVDSQTQVTSNAASGTRKSFDTLLVYPTTLRQSNQDTIHFTMMEYVSKGLGGDKGQFGGGQRTNDRKSIGRVVLPIPAGINDSNQVNWASGSMNAGQMALAGIALKGITDGLTEAGKEATNQINKALGAGAGDVKSAITQTIAGAATGDSKALMQRTTGQVINPNMELLFGGPQLRDFSFAFNFTARSAGEGRTILRILRFFKQGMSPIRSESNLFLKSPHTFKLEYKNGSRDHKALNKFKECALKSCALQYTPDGNYATFEDGVMTKYQMTLGFTELEPVFNDDYASFSKDEIGY